MKARGLQRYPSLYPPVQVKRTCRRQCTSFQALNKSIINPQSLPSPLRQALGGGRGGDGARVAKPSVVHALSENGPGEATFSQTGSKKRAGVCPLQQKKVYPIKDWMVVLQPVLQPGLAKALSAEDMIARRNMAREEAILSE